MQHQWRTTIRVSILADLQPARRTHSVIDPGSSAATRVVVSAGEEMGLGKTVEVTALLLSNPAPALQPEQETTADGLVVSRCCS